MATPASGDGDGSDGGGVATAVVEGASGGNVEEGGTEVVLDGWRTCRLLILLQRLLLRFR